MHVILFDIDGTLLRGFGIGSRAMLRAGQAICGLKFDLEGVMISGGLDPIIYREAAIKMGLNDHHTLHDEFRDRYLHELERELRELFAHERPPTVAEAPLLHAAAAAAGARRPELLPGIHALLQALSGRDDVAVGLLTGNYQRAVPLKFAAVGLDIQAFVAGGFGDDADTRPGLLPVALQRMERALGVGLHAKNVVVVGDTIRDVDCALQNGSRCLAVGTGYRPLEELQKAGAHRVVADLSDPESLLSML
ncbi:MAG TPA: HAD family hydrolase [Polyangiales bacterium]|nr:HAD family hydrolase [Polyangiales bacterium]